MKIGDLEGRSSCGSGYLNMSGSSGGASCEKVMNRSGSSTCLTNIGRGGGDGQTHGPIFTGMRILLVGFSLFCKKELTKKITDRGGRVLASADYELHTHICVAGETQNSDKRIVTKDWIKLCCDRNERLDICEICTRSTNKRTMCFNEIDMILHEFFVCEADRSEKISLQQYVNELKSLTTTQVTPPGSSHLTITTVLEVKAAVREIYLLLKSLHNAGFSLAGAFSIKDFVLHKSRMKLSMKFANVAKTALQQFRPDTENKDFKRLVRMVLREVFKKESPPHDITLWLSMVGQQDIKELMPYHVLLMDVEECGEEFQKLYDIFLDLAEGETFAKTEMYRKVCEELEVYNGWQQKMVVVDERNSLMSETYDREEYKDTVTDLLRLLRNNRQHTSRYEHSLFALIVGQNFPNIIADLQKSLYLVGCLTSSNRLQKVSFP